MRIEARPRPQRRDTMMHRLLWSGRGLLLLAALAGGLSGCKQREGDRCQLNSDCEDGLTCTNSASGASYQSPTGGVCKNLAPQDMTGVQPQDLSVKLDQSGADLTSATDGPPADGGG